MKNRYVCNERHPGCDYTIEDEQREAVEREATEHLKVNHPDEALEADKARATLDSFIRAGV